MQTYNISKKTFAANYSMITAPGKYTVQAQLSNKVLDKNLGKFKWIINLRAVADRHVDEVRALFKGQEEIDRNLLNGLTMTHNIIENEGQVIAIPARNEMVDIVVDYVITKSGEQVLAVTAMIVKPAVKAKAFSFDDEEEDEYAELKATPAEVPAKEKAVI